jgi:hypothetical protein
MFESGHSGELADILPLSALDGNADPKGATSRPQNNRTAIGQRLRMQALLATRPT